MFSITTIASSIKMPIESDRAISVNTLSVKPITSITMNDEITDTGSASDVMAVAFQSLRKSMTMSTVRSAPVSSSWMTSRIELRMKVELSRTTRSDAPGGSPACTRASAAFTPSATSTVFAPDTLRMLIEIARLPSSRASDRSSGLPSSTRATSRTRTGSPSRVATITSPKIAADAVELGAQVLRGIVHLAAELELDDHLRHALDGNGRDVANALHGIERLLQAPRDFALHALGARTGESGLHGDDRQIDRGE